MTTLSSIWTFFAPASPTGIGWPKILPSGCTYPIPSDSKVAADKAVRLALDHFDDLTRGLIAAAARFAAELHRDGVAARGVERVVAVDEDIHRPLGFARRAGRADKAEAGGSPAKDADDAIACALRGLGFLGDDSRNHRCRFWRVDQVLVPPRQFAAFDHAFDQALHLPRVGFVEFKLLGNDLGLDRFVVRVADVREDSRAEFIEVDDRIR